MWDQVLWVNFERRMTNGHRSDRRSRQFFKLRLISNALKTRLKRGNCIKRKTFLSKHFSALKFKSEKVWKIFFQSLIGFWQPRKKWRKFFRIWMEMFVCLQMGTSAAEVLNKNLCISAAPPHLRTILKRIMLFYDAPLQRYVDTWNWICITQYCYGVLFNSTGPKHPSSDSMLGTEVYTWLVRS